MTNTKHYLVSLLIILLIAAVDRYVFIELQPAPPNMVWIDGGNFTATSKDEFTDRDADQDYQMAGFWIDKSVVSKSGYEAFVAATGYAGTLAAAHPTADSSAMLHQFAGHQLFSLRDAYDANNPDLDPHALQTISYDDAMAYCEWKGMELSSQRQTEFAQASGDVVESAVQGGTTVHASQPLSNQSGFRCVKLPEWAHQQGYSLN